MSYISKKTLYSSESYSQSHTAVMSNIPIGLLNPKRALLFCAWHFGITHTCVLWHVPHFVFAWSFLEDRIMVSLSVYLNMPYQEARDDISQSWDCRRVLCFLFHFLKMSTFTVVVSGIGTFGKWYVTRRKALLVKSVPYRGYNEETHLWSASGQKPW